MRRRDAKLSGHSEHLRLTERIPAFAAMTEHKNPVLTMHWVFEIAQKCLQSEPQADLTSSLRSLHLPELRRCDFGLR